MAHSLHEGCAPYDPDSDFDFEHYYGEDSAQLESTLDALPRAFSDPKAPGRKSRFGSHHKQVDASEVPSASQNHADAFDDIGSESLGEPSQPPISTGNDLYHEFGQSSSTRNLTAELHHIDDELEEVELKLRRSELQKRRRKILQDLPMGPQARTYERPGLLDLGTPNDRSAQLTSQDMMADEASQGSDVFPTAFLPLDDTRLNNSYNVDIGTSGRGSMHLLNGGVDSRYGLASTDLSCFGFADLSSNAHGASPHVGVLEHFNSMSVGLPNPGSIHQCRIQGPVPALGSDQTRMQPSLPNSQHRHGIDPVQPVSNLSSLQHNEPFPNSDTNMIVRKRPRSPQLAEAQRLHGVRQLLSKRTGVPETSLGLICFNTQPAPKRSRTSSQKQNKEDVLNAGGSCFLCLILKKKCSRERPCEQCRTYWQKRVHDSTSFTWTCDVQTKLTDLNIFKQPFKFISDYARNTLDSHFGGYGAFLAKFEYLFGLTNNLEPPSPDFYSIGRNGERGRLSFYNYIHAMIGWKKPLIYLISQLHHDLAFLETFYRYSCPFLFNYCDQAHRLPDKHEAVLVVVYTFYGIKCLKATETLDIAVADHLQLALQHRLKIFCSRIFDFDESKRIVWDQQGMLAIVVQTVPELSLCLPPPHRQWSRIHGATLKGTTPYYQALRVSDTPLDLPSCLLHRSNSSKYYYDNAKTENCCCGWTLDSTPSSFLAFFDHSAPSFAHYVHLGSRNIGLEEVGVSFDPCQAMKSVFRGPRSDNTTLRDRMLVFGGTMSFWLKSSFGLIGRFIEDLNNECLKNDLIEETQGEQLDRLAHKYRQQVFSLILRSAVTMYHDFWISAREGETHAESCDQLLLQFVSWKENREMGSEIVDFTKALGNIHFKRIGASLGLRGKTVSSVGNDAAPRQHHVLSQPAWWQTGGKSQVYKALLYP